MTMQNKSLIGGFPENMEALEEIQTQTMKNWHNSIDSAFSSLSQLFNFSNDTMNTLNRYQKESLELYFDTGSSSSEVKGKEKPGTVPEKEALTGVAVVTGGIGGIGTAICQRLSRDNAKIITTYISAEKEAAEAWQKDRLAEGLNTDIFECDVSSFDSCKKAARKIEKKYGPVDVLVNCAGITRDAMLKKLDENNWHAVIDTNLDSVFNVTRNFLDGMLKKGYGRIINISSVNGQKGQFGQTNYSSAKAGIIGFSRSLAIELADKGITVNSVCPGYVGTSMVEAIPDHVKQAIIAQIPMGRLATPAEIAHSVAFLAAAESAYITGTEVAVNGGLWTG